MKKFTIFLLSALMLTTLLTGCNSDSTSDSANTGQDYQSDGAGKDDSGGSNSNSEMASSDAMAKSANNGDYEMDFGSFGMAGMSGMGDIETLMKGNEPMPKEYKPRFLLVGEVNVTIGDTFYHLASVYDDYFKADDYVPKSEFKILDDEQKMEVRIVGAPVWQDKLMSPVIMTIKFKIPLPVNMEGPDGINREYIPMGQYPGAVTYPRNIANMVQTGGQEYYWGYLMGGGGYYVDAETNQTVQFAFGAFILPAK